MPDSDSLVRELIEDIVKRAVQNMKAANPEDRVRMPPVPLRFGASRWGVSTQYLRSLIHEGKLKAIHVGNRLRVDLDELDRAMSTSPDKSPALVIEEKARLLADRAMRKPAAGDAS